MTARAHRLNCFEAGIDTSLLDRDSFLFRHRLCGHPALTLENLGRVIPKLPKRDVYYSSGTLREGDNLDVAHIEYPNGLSIEQTMEQIRTSRSYVMVRSPESDPSFRELYRDLLSDVEFLIRTRGTGSHARDPKLYLFIASPGSITPFHIDRYSTFLLQFSGTKTVSVFPPWDERVTSAQAVEDYVLRQGKGPDWEKADRSLARDFTFCPGDALHIPFVAGHYVRNGDDAVSISMSIIFNTDQTIRQIRAMSFNQKLSRALRTVGMRPQPVGQSPTRDAAKGRAYAAIAKLSHALRFTRTGNHKGA
jgi:hypothetical protein